MSFVKKGTEEVLADGERVLADANLLSDNINKEIEVPEALLEPAHTHTMHCYGSASTKTMRVLESPHRNTEL